MVMRRVLLGAVVVVSLLAFYLAIFPVGQQPDRSFDSRVSNPAYTDRHPRVLFDEAHHNSHSLSGGYRAFGELLRSDGYMVERNREKLTPGVLSKADVLVIVNPAGGSNPKLFGFNLVPLRKGRREAPAFTREEIAAVQGWVSRGGALLLIADHYPFGSASAGLARAFGITMRGGYAEVPAAFAMGDPSNIRFTRANGLLAESSITNGQRDREQVHEVISFTGQSFDAPRATPLLRLPSGSAEYVPPPPNFTKTVAGALQGAAIQVGRGRIVVLGEAAMFTAQVDDGRKFGMNVAAGNRQFALNVMHWLSGLF